jgi:hypothetical protein
MADSTRPNPGVLGRDPINFDKPLIDPTFNARLSDGCHNGVHFREANAMTCQGWMDGATSLRCECPCHDDRPKAQKPRKAVSMELPFDDPQA